MNLLIALIISLCLIIPHFLATRRIGINLMDEGYLWYGVLRVRVGEIPIRDYRAYDPARYYWGAAGSWLFGKGLLGLRASVMIFQIIGLILGLLVILDVFNNVLLAIFVGVILLSWMFPRHKYFEHSFTLISVWAAYQLLQNPTQTNFILIGIYVGHLFLWGINHGLYNILIFGIVTIFSWILIPDGRAVIMDVVWLIIGGLIGITPFLAFVFLVPGMRGIYFDKHIYPIFRRGTANLPRPIPWLWKGKLDESFRGSDRLFTYRLLFTFLPFVYIAFVLIAVFAPMPNPNLRYLLLASSCVGIGYLHHFISRADVSHLAQVILPFWIGLTVVISLHPMATILGIIMIGLLTWYGIPIEQRVLLHFIRNRDFYKQYHIENKTFWFLTSQVHLIRMITTLLEDRSESNQDFLIAPLEIGLYPLFDYVAPNYDTFCLYPTDERNERQMIAELEASKVSIAIVNNIHLDNREALCFQNTHPLTWKFLHKNFQVEKLQQFRGDYYLFTRTVPELEAN